LLLFLFISYSEDMQKELLAINQYKDTIIGSLKKHQVIVVEAPTGSGKTTQIPQIIYEAGLDNWGLIGVTQPRRIAAMGVSSRIAEEMNTQLSQLVGYKIRFDDYTSEQTKIKIMTDGILLEELRSDPLLKKYSIMMIDEAHERSLNIDFILGLLKEILKERSDLKVVISSATINAPLFSQYFHDAPIISVETKPYPVEIKYLPLNKKGDFDEIIERIVQIVDRLEHQKIEGDVLVFLTGEEIIKTCCRELELLAVNQKYKLAVLPIYARLAPEEQNRVFHDFPGKRKVVVATNIAETSITIDGIIHVIDPGFCKMNYYNPRTFTSFLETKMISQASCNQRSGRAGRTAPGIVYRLFSEEDYQAREEFTKEEIYRTDLSEVVLRMADLGITHYTEFDFISPPNRGAVYSAIETLNSLNALEENKLTQMGKMMVDFPLSPRHSRILFEALTNYPQVANKILIIISFLSTKTPFLYPKGEEIESRQAQRKLSSKGGDFFTWLNVFYKYVNSNDRELFCKKYYLDTRAMNEIVKIHHQLCDMVIDRNYPIKDGFDYNKIAICISAGLRQYMCKKENKKRNSYRSPTEQDIRIHPGSFLFGESHDWIVGGEIVNTGRTYVRTAVMVPEKIVKTCFVDEYKQITSKKEPRKVVAVTTTKRPAKETIPDRIEVLDKYFDVVQIKKERLVHVPYQIIIQLQNRKTKIMRMDFGKISARLVYKDYIILKDNFTSLLKYFDKINLDQGMNFDWPRNQLLLYPDDWTTIYRYLPNLIRPTARTRKNKKAGFLTLRYLGEDTYDYYLEYDFFTAIEENLNSLEILFEFDIKAWTEKEKKKLDNIHHYLNNLAEEMEV
ncbi:MAG: ATP-dependent RNA helicase, partial [Spirochaetes bacterium]|nr:ATP-dependent RNA helicase [Spirochaetota bacterium]